LVRVQAAFGCWRATVVKIASRARRHFVSGIGRRCDRADNLDGRVLLVAILFRAGTWWLWQDNLPFCIVVAAASPLLTPTNFRLDYMWTTPIVAIALSCREDGRAAGALGSSWVSRRGRGGTGTPPCAGRCVPTSSKPLTNNLPKAKRAACHAAHWGPDLFRRETVSGFRSSTAHRSPHWGCATRLAPATSDRHRNRLSAHNG
jgi:hypothetical protein